MMKVVLFLTCLIFGLCAGAGNPFEGVTLYVNPTYVAEVQSTINQNPTLKPLLSAAQNVPAAYWIDSIAKISNLSTILDGALAQQKQSGKPVLTFIIIYDLPNRDCAALASNGEILCADSQCVAGLQEYESQYINPIVAILSKYATQPIVALIEPDSLPNLATNLNIPKCQEAQTAYIHGTAYAIQSLSKLSNVNIYVDAAHGGWLGWENNRVAFAQIIQQVLNLAGGAQTIRGFATNTANYQPLGSINNLADPCNLRSQYNNASNEVIYISLLSQTLASYGITGKGYITDTSRNGVTNERSDCANWCNINNSGLGYKPTSVTSGITGIDIIDAFYWVKVPGESDGTSNTTSPRYDAHCTSVDSKVPAPQAGDWWPAFFIMLAQNSNPPLQ